MSETAPTLDDQLRSRIIQTLAQQERTAILDLRVGVLNGIAHLAGRAPSLELWNLTERIVSGVAGVRGVVNRIEAPGAPSPSRTIHLNLPAIRIMEDDMVPGDE